MIRELSAAVLACGLGVGVLGCQDQNNGNPNNNADNTYPSSSGNMSGSSGTYDSSGRYNSGTGTSGSSTWDNRNSTPSGNAHGGMNSGTGYDRGSNNREQTGGFMNNTGSMSKEQPSTQPQP